MNRKERRAAQKTGAGAGGAAFQSGAPEVANLFAAATGHHQAGRFAEAEGLYRRVLAADPNHVMGLQFLGVLAHQVGRSEAAIELIGRAIALNNRIPECHYNLAAALQTVGRLDEAAKHYAQALKLRPDFAEAHYELGNVNAKQAMWVEAAASYQRALALKPNYVEAHTNLGNMLMEQGRADEAVAHWRRALALAPDYPVAQMNIGLALKKQGNLDEAAAHFRQVLARRPDYAEAHNNLGNVLKEQGRLDEAVAQYKQALKVAPDFAPAHNNLGLALHAQGRADEAAACYERALSLAPDYAEAHGNLGAAYQEQGRLDEALPHYQRALALTPSFAPAHNNLGRARHAQGKLDEAVEHYERALVLDPDFVEANFNLGSVLAMQGRSAEARAHFERALVVQPDHAEARIALCMAQLPVLYADEGEIAERRAAYETHLRALCDQVERSGRPRDLAKGLGASQPFFIAYQGMNDRDLQALYGSLVCRVMADCYPAATLSAPPRADEPVRVGIVSGFFRQHSVWKIVSKGWLSQLDRQRFRLFGYHTGGQHDDETRIAVAACERFVQGPLPLDRWREEILADAPHVLLYPEVGMDLTCPQLAAQRLAPVQCSSWGHPQTSGFPTLDYFLTSDLMEPPDGDGHYTERLIRLPNIGVYYEPLDAPAVSIGRAELGLRTAATVFWCAQSLFKYLPQFDEVFPRIAREVGDCQFTFIEYQSGPHITGMFQERLRGAFAAHGLRAEDHCVILPRLDQHRFAAAVSQCDVVLDSIGWSGGNTTLEGLPHDVPIVTMAGPLMRGRHTTAMLRMMGVTDTIGETVDDYVAAAVRLAREPEWRMDVKRRMAENRHRVYRDKTYISALEDFLDKAARGGIDT